MRPKSVTSQAAKSAAAKAALAYVSPGALIGVGTGSTVTLFIEAMADGGAAPSAAVVTSADTRAKLARAGIPVVELEEVGELDVYIDGADEIDPFGRLIKGAGGALTMEKIVASASGWFVCIADESKSVASLGARARLPLEVLPHATRLVQEEILALGGVAEVRAGFTTDGGNRILDVSGLEFSEPIAIERRIDAIPGVIECGLFAIRRADVALIGLVDGGVRTVHFGR